MPIQAAPSNELVYFNVPNCNPIPHLQEPEFKAFGWLVLNTAMMPNWLSSVITNEPMKNNQKHWSQINDFDLEVGDIKTIWEYSRFHWLFPMVIAFLKSGDKQHVEKLNHWLNNWLSNNPVNQGVNWKCGQEASIRVIHLIATHHLLWQQQPLSPALADFIYQHLLRIVPTISYAVAQDNNHGTSEAAALFVGATTLSHSAHNIEESQLKHWITLARNTIENRCNKLIAKDGCFSQHSTNYHRLMLDTLSFTEFIRQVYQASPFSITCYKKLQLATSWLALTTREADGQSAMLGLNDGAQLLPVTCCDFTDLRPSVQWASQLFLGHSAYPANDDIDQLSKLFPAASTAPKTSTSLPVQMCSDYHSMECNGWRIFLRTPTNTFRPSQCDALHCDVWHQATNLLISSGTYSYNDTQWQSYFPSTMAHNTVCFDNDEQMTKISRFLYSNWLKVKVQQQSNNQLIASYLDGKKRHHRRTIIAKQDSLTITDSLSGFKHQAVMRFHLPQIDWQLRANELIGKGYIISIKADVAIEKIALVEGWQSRYYQNKTPIWVLEVTVKHQGTISTELAAKL